MPRRLDHLYRAQNVDADEEQKKESEDEDDGPQVFAGPSGLELSYLAGIVSQEDAQSFKRMVFRVTRGTAWTLMGNIEYDEDEEGNLIQPLIDPKTNEVIKRSVFLIVYRGGAFDMLKNKLNRIADAYNAQKYSIPQNHQMFKQKI